MLAGTIDSVIRFLVQKYVEVMFAGDSFHQIHDELVVVVRQITVFEDRSQLELIGSYFVVTGLGGNPQFMAFNFEFLHKGSDTWRNRTEVMVFQLLVFGGRMSHQSPSCQAKIGARII